MQTIDIVYEAIPEGTMITPAGWYEDAKKLFEKKQHTLYLEDFCNAVMMLAAVGLVVRNPDSVPSSASSMRYTMNANGTMYMSSGDSSGSGSRVIYCRSNSPY